MTDQTPQTTTEPVENLSAKLTAIRDKFLIPTPDKDFTDYAVITRCIEALTTPQPLAIGLDRSNEVVGRNLYEAFWVRNGGVTVAWCDQASAIRNMWDAIGADAIIALAAPAEVGADVASALLWFGSQHNLELSYGYEVDGEGDDGWQVHSVNGGRNDREWTRLSFGHDTPIKAIAACLPAAPTGGRS